MDPNARVWPGQGPPAEQRIRFLGIPIGHSEFVESQFRATTVKHSVLYERILHVQDLQSARLLLLFCANTEAMYSLRGIPLSETSQFVVVADRNCSSRSGQHPMCFRRVGGNEVSPLASWADSEDDQSQASCSGRHHRPVFVRPLRFRAFQCRGHMRCRVPCRVMMFLSGGGGLAV